MVRMNNRFYKDSVIKGLRKLAGRANHVVIPKGRIFQLRAYEESVTGSLSMLTDAVLNDCAQHNVGTEEWKSGILDELRFWWNILAKRTSSPEKAVFLEKFLLKHDFAYGDQLDGGPRDIEVLDIGCALFPAIGRNFGNQTVHVTAADPLATGYNRLMDLFGIERQYNLVFGVAEQTATIFGEDRFDFILAQNSIDHSYDPASAFEQICKALRSGGAAQFEHYSNEAENQNYHGFHKWNLEPHSEGCIRIWNLQNDVLFDFSEHGCEAKIHTYKRKKHSGVEVEAFQVRVKKA